jgi:transposase InsO family protein
MNKLYNTLGISKQSFHQKMDRFNYHRLENIQLLLVITDVRGDHPTMGVRDMYYKIMPENIGRDAFEEFCAQQGLKSVRIKNYHRTTDSSGVIRFDNLIKNKELTSINQVWQSDITYFEVAGKFYYLTFIMDAYSRRIIGHSVSKRLTTESTTLPALAMAIKLRKKQKLSIKQVIFHSDGGGQYYDSDFLLLTGKFEFQNSMCKFPWENGKAERINGVIKNNYLIHRGITSYEMLVKEVDRSVLLYNTQKPHIKLKRKTPVTFENDYLCSGQQSDGEKSATELDPQFTQGSALRAEDNNPSGSISLKN